MESPGTLRREGKTVQDIEFGLDTLFGYDLSDYESLFEEKLDLLVRLIRDQPVTWSGRHRSSLVDQTVSPPLPEGHLPTWVGVGGSPESVIRAARYRLPLILAAIGGDSTRLAPYVELYRRVLANSGGPELPVGAHSLGYIATTDDLAAEIQWPHWRKSFEDSARERGWAQPTRAKVEEEISSGIGWPPSSSTAEW
jgi:alkanesulfonate monooxygenase SsuD/methylene tetrahydromethanopterin reductase-like flavin-dependent oxidoreductase (luciferase family)